MSTPFIVPTKKDGKHREKLKIKKCAFPGCKKSFEGTGKSRYCEEHRQRKYRKLIDAGKAEAKKAEEEARSPNQNIKHSYTSPVCVKMECKLEGCGQEFEVKIFPNVYVYPKFCSEHRNEFKRKMFTEKMKKVI